MQANDQFGALLFPVLKLLCAAWKSILAGSVGGAALAAGYLAVTAPQYEASALISMAQVPATGNASSNSAAISIANIEDPAFLIERLKMHTTYTPAAIAACGMGQGGTPAEAMSGLIRTILPRGVGSAILIMVRKESPQLATQCVNGLFEMIRAQQAAMVKSVEEDQQGALVDLEARLSAISGELEKAERLGLHQLVFLARREELLFLNQQLYTLRRDTRRMKPTTLVSPIYAGAKPVAPQRSLVLIAATLAGLFGGLLLAAGRRAARWRANVGGG